MRTMSIIITPRDKIMAKFEVGDVIRNTLNEGALNYAEIYAVDDKYYYCKILRGTAMIPISAESTYEKRKKDERVNANPYFY